MSLYLRQHAQLYQIQERTQTMRLPLLIPWLIEHPSSCAQILNLQAQKVAQMSPTSQERVPRSFFYMDLDAPYALMCQNRIHPYVFLLYASEAHCLSHIRRALDQGDFQSQLVHHLCTPSTNDTSVYWIMVAQAFYTRFTFSHPQHSFTLQDCQYDPQECARRLRHLERLCLKASTHTLQARCPSDARLSSLLLSDQTLLDQVDAFCIQAHQNLDAHTLHALHQWSSLQPMHLPLFQRLSDHLDSQRTAQHLKNQLPNSTASIHLLKRRL